jgi:hypothetical protein
MANSATGKIAKIYSDSAGCYVRLKDPQPSPSPMDGYFQLRLNHENYPSIYALVLAAAANGWAITIRVKGQIITSEHAVINYVTVDFG